MADIYNLSNYTDANNLYELAIAANGLSGGFYFVIILVMILIISFVAMKRFPAGQALVSSTFITFMLAGILWLTQLVGESVVIAFFIFFVLSAAAKTFIGD